MSNRYAVLLTGTFCATLLGAGAALAADQRIAPDVFTAVTTAMKPDDLKLRLTIRDWSNDEGRKDVVVALGSDDPGKALKDLPTLGYVWTDGSPVGYSVKYAKRTPADDGEHIVFVTDKPLGSYDNKPWTADGEPPETGRDYSVIELDLDREGHGVGTLSLVADPIIDESAASVDLPDQGMPLLKDVLLEPKPYWAK